MWISFKVEDKINKLTFYCIDDEKLLEKYNVIWTKIKELKNTELDALLVYDNKYIKIKIGIYSEKVYTNFSDLNVPEDDM